MNPVAYVPPPAPEHLNDALSLVRLALNPQAAAEFLEKLKAQTDAHDQARSSRMAESRDLEAKTASVNTREAGLSAREAAVAAREGAASQMEATLSAKQQLLEARESAVVESERALGQSRFNQDAKIRNFEQVSASRMAELDTREAELAEREKAHQAKVQRLKELV
jgi:hypothetical protein